ncbi:MAG: hypothetical protein IJO72_02060 [Oscillospiraceae bacterium]|nr:hypothetical protein [Oscillospiraceae bacterium]
MQIDFHTHLLPNMDDGSQSEEESRQMLAALKAQGVELAVATPHFYSEKARLDHFLQERSHAYEQLCSACTDVQPKLLLGAEVSFFRGMGKADRLKELCVTGTDVLLIEMPFSQWGRGEIAELHHIIDRGITPILAHIERYDALQKDLRVLNEIINMPVLLQVNAGALLQRKSRKFVFQLIDSGFAVVLGTDCHNTDTRKPDMDAGREILARKYGDAYLARLDALSAEILKM